MLNVILSIKFVHMIAMAVMFGAWVTMALFMLMAYRSRNTSVVALTSVFVVRAELMVMIPAVALQPLAGFPLAIAIGSSVTAYWMVVSSVIYVAVLAAWLGNLVIEFRIRKISQEAALNNQPLPDAYARLFRIWSVVAVIGIAGMIVIMALMIWQPQWS